MSGNEYIAADPYIGDDGLLIGPDRGGDGDRGLSSADIAIIVVGVCVGAALLAAMLWLLGLCRRSPRQAPSSGTIVRPPRCAQLPGQAVVYIPSIGLFGACWGIRLTNEIR